MVHDLSVAEQQMVEIAKAMSFDARVMVMDEPTAALSTREVDVLFGLIRQLKARGVTVVYISHRFREIFSIADRVTVLKDGAKVATRERAGLQSAELVRLMVGRDLADYYPDRAQPDELGEVVLKVNGGGNAACTTSTSRCARARCSASRGCRARDAPSSRARCSAPTRSPAARSG
jgi:ribose transport system ATP-binding protein